MVTSSNEEQVPVEVVHLKIYVPGTASVTVVPGKVLLVIVGIFGPLVKVHKPVPVVGVFPANVNPVWLQTAWSGPA
jgi:hypothetical protein